jgi:hypothetical protein
MPSRSLQRKPRPAAAAAAPAIPPPLLPRPLGGRGWQSPRCRRWVPPAGRRCLGPPGSGQGRVHGPEQSSRGTLSVLGVLHTWQAQPPSRLTGSLLWTCCRRLRPPAPAMLHVWHPVRPSTTSGRPARHGARHAAARHCRLRPLTTSPRLRVLSVVRMGSSGSAGGGGARALSGARSGGAAPDGRGRTLAGALQAACSMPLACSWCCAGAVAGCRGARRVRWAAPTAEVAWRCWAATGLTSQVLDALIHH